MLLDILISTLLYGIPIKDVKQLKSLITNVYHEASGEGVAGMNAAAHVVLNRVDSRRFPSTISKVVHQSSQFSWTLIGHDLPIIVNNFIDRQALEDAVVVSAMAYNGMTLDPTGGAMWYYNPDKANPSWKDTGELVYSVNNHDFYKGVK